jgi:hypothetical protein
MPQMGDSEGVYAGGGRENLQERGLAKPGRGGDEGQPAVYHVSAMTS